MTAKQVLPDDFTDYAEGIQRKIAFDALKLERLKEYEIWRNTTWAGKYVHMIIHRDTTINYILYNLFYFL